MRKGMIAGLIVTIALVLVSAVYAHWPVDGYGTCGLQNADCESMKSFHKDTLLLRDELITKRYEIRKEFSKVKPDRERVAALQKEMIDIRTKIMMKADESGVDLQKRNRTNCGRPFGKGIMKRCQNPIGL
jgi:hypothetical protein